MFDRKCHWYQERMSLLQRIVAWWKLRKYPEPEVWLWEQPYVSPMTFDWSDVIVAHNTKRKENTVAIWYVKEPLDNEPYRDKEGLA